MDLIGALAGAAGAAGEAGNPWDISTAVYNGRPFNTLGFQTLGNPRQIFFKSDGTKFYMLQGGSLDAVYEYDLSVGWDFATISFVQSFSVASQETDPNGLFFKSDGTKMYVIGGAGDDVNEYSLSTAWDISTASYSQNFSIAAQDTDPWSLFFKPDGTKMYVLGRGGYDVNEYSLSTAWDISSASYVQNFSVLSQEDQLSGLWFKPDGTKMYIVGFTGDDITEYSLSTAWDISSASYTREQSIVTRSPNPVSLVFKPDGTQVYTMNLGGVLTAWDMSPAWDISTISYTNQTTDFLYVAAQEASVTGLFFKPDGTKMYISGANGDEINEYDLSTAWNIDSASFLQNFSVAAQEANPQGVFFKPDGTKMYMLGSTGDDVNEYSLSTAWDISSSSYVQNFSVAAQETAPNGLFFKSDGTKMYIVGSQGDDVNEYDLSTAWDISTASYLQAFSVASQSTAPMDLFFRADGLKMYVVSIEPNAVFEYDLATAWNVSTASFLQSLSLAYIFPSTYGIFFKDDGTKMYLADLVLDAVISYDL